MKLLARYPIAFKAHPGRCENPKTVVCSYPVVVDVPEVSPAEVMTVMEVGLNRVVEYDGRLFRLVGRRDGKYAQSFLSEPFVGTDQSLPYQMASGDGSSLFQQQAAGKPLRNHVYHRLFIQFGERPRETSLYPVVSNNVFHRGATSRNSCLYEKIEKRLQDVDGSAFQSGVDEATSEAGKLLMAGNDLWVETPPPALSAESDDAHRSPLNIRITFLPDWLDPDLGRQYFPLDATGEAVEYLNSMRPLVDRSLYAENIPSAVSSFTHDAACNLLRFDHVAYSQQRTGLLMGGDLARAIDAHPEKADTVTAASRAAAMKARELATACGTAWRDWPDVDDIVCDVTEGWLEAKRPLGAAYIPDGRHAFGSFVCRRAAELADARPITVDTLPTWKTMP